MDKLAKRAGVAMLVVAAAGSAFALGLARFASSVETERVAATPHVAAARRMPDPMPAPAVETPKPVEVPVVVVMARPAVPAEPQKAAALAPKKIPARPSPAPERAPIAAREPPADDMLDLDFGAHSREAQLADRGPNAFGVRQLGGAEEKHRRLIPGERVTFETDLASPAR
jgi:hypothetical protein